jgi:hypothetical protein
MRRLPALATAIAVLLLVPASASAQTAPSITLSASADRIVFGQDVTLSGTVSDGPEGTAVEIVNADGTSVASVTTDGWEAFSATIAPEGSNAYRAVVGDASSDAVRVQVRAVVSVRMSPVRLFDSVTVRGTVAPAREGRRVEVTLTRGGHAVDMKRVAMGSRGGFHATMRIPEPGTYRVRASFVAAGDLLRGVATSQADATPLPHLSLGDSGAFVRLLEQRLVELDYRLAQATDGRYDFRTADAVVAFHKVQRMNRTFVVDAATWRRLVDPLEPHAKRTWRGFHFEVDQTRQVLYTVEDGDITNVLHVSTGAGGATHDGTFRVWRKIAGFSGNHLYYPSYFDGLRALHGWTEVPTYAASHGCVRIPYWNAKWVYALADYGTRVVVYH